MISVTISRTALSLADLVIDTNPFGTAFHLPEDGVSSPEFAVRRAYAPDSAWVSGKALLAAVIEASVLPLAIYAHGDTWAEVENRKTELATATLQWSYLITLTVEGVAQSWQADPELPTWGPVDSGMVRGRLARGVLQVPINPTGAP